MALRDKACRSGIGATACLRGWFEYILTGMKQVRALEHTVNPAAVRKLRAAATAARTTRSAASKSRSTGDGLEDIRDAVSRLKRERIVSTAVKLFHDRGLANTTLEAVAEQMNVTKPFIYSHFKSKNDLLAEICAQGIRASLDALNRVMGSEGTATEKLEAMAREFILAVIRNQGHIAIYTREQKHLSKKDGDAIDEMRREFDRKFCALLGAGVATGEFVVDDVQLAALAIGGIVSWSYVWYRPSGRLAPEETADGIANLVLAMVHAKPARRKRAPASAVA